MPISSTSYVFGVLVALTSILSLSSCSSDTAPSNQPNTHSAAPMAPLTADYQQGVVYAINVGGDAYQGQDGLHYQADNLSVSASQHRSDEIKGSQDPQLYQSYRQGDMQIPLELANGRYHVTFKFAEPDEKQVGERLINVYAQDQLVLDQLDIRLARDGKTRSALDRTVSDIEVNNGQLKLALSGVKGEPVLHALIVRKAHSAEQQWQLVWQDEFNYQGQPDPQKWSHDVWPARKVNDEDQAYTDRLKNARVENGRLVIEAHKEDYQGAKYTSARLHSLAKGDWLYGKVEVRARIPAGQGTWSAIWMLPSDPFKYATSCQAPEDWQGSQTCDAWPNSGEIDIMEYVGYDPTTIHGTVHTKAYYWVNWEQRKASIEVDEQVNTEFQTYSMEWGPQYISISMNDAPYFYYANQGEGWQAWPFDHAYHLILNLAIGGAWGRAGGPIDDSVFPTQMEVDYVRVYERKQ